MKLQIETEGFELDTELEKYLTRKLTQLARHIPRAEKPAAGFVVQLRRKVVRETKQNTCTLSLVLTNQTLQASEMTQHLHTAVDVTAVSVGEQLKRYAREQRNARRRLSLRRHKGTV